ncbi:hypothetical protein L798_02651 [Zootermopsis nevadensis]|uniref:Uncharacterized protein n=1 Tax=Zootermopsis nevadensis TaxID=136037 RepID=A0A067QUH1_ZOONE|nr:hypothetical protein L798_02651 [Zootermopsis nevadensis]
MVGPTDEERAKCAVEVQPVHPNQLRSTTCPFYTISFAFENNLPRIFCVPMQSLQVPFLMPFYFVIGPRGLRGPLL